MDTERKAKDPTLVCTCSGLYIDDIKEAVLDGEDDYRGIMQCNATYPRCGECQEHVERLVKLINES